MCGSEGSWVEEGWKPFADLGHDLIAAARQADADADAPLAHEADDRSAVPDTPLA
jgi:hypothetical protein